MIDALYIGAASMDTQQSQLDAIAHNLTNMNTPAYKKVRVQFREVMNQTQLSPASDQIFRGAGVGVAHINLEFKSGELKQTGSSMDLAINGNGFVPISLPDGGVGYSRGGILKIDANGFLTTRDGYPLQPAIQLPSDAKSFAIASDGRVEAEFVDRMPMEMGRLELARFADASALRSLGGGVYQATVASGDATIGEAGEQGLGVFVQGSLEAANVQMIDEMVSLMLTQRAYEMSSKLVQAADEMMSLTNNLRR